MYSSPYTNLIIIIFPYLVQQCTTSSPSSPWLPSRWSIITNWSNIIIIVTFYIEPPQWVPFPPVSEILFLLAEDSPPHLYLSTLLPRSKDHGHQQFSGWSDQENAWSLMISLHLNASKSSDTPSRHLHRVRSNNWQPWQKQITKRYEF